MLRRLAGTKLNVPGVSRAWNPEAAGKKTKERLVYLDLAGERNCTTNNNDDSMQHFPAHSQVAKVSLESTALPVSHPLTHQWAPSVMSVRQTRPIKVKGKYLETERLSLRTFVNFPSLLFGRLLIPLRKQTRLPLLHECHEDFSSRASPPAPPASLLTKIIARLSCAAIVGFVIGTPSNPTRPRRRIP